MSTSEITTSTTTITTTTYKVKTNFEDVCDFNSQFGVNKLNAPCLDDETFIESKMALIREEMSELAFQNTGKTSQLSPLFVEEMMGFPRNWTVLPFQSGERKV